ALPRRRFARPRRRASHDVRALERDQRRSAGAAALRPDPAGGLAGALRPLARSAGDAGRPGDPAASLRRGETLELEALRFADGPIDRHLATAPLSARLVEAFP